MFKVSKLELEKLAKTSNYEAKLLAKLCQVSPRQLQRDFKREFGRSPQDWLNEQRLVAAGQLLQDGASVKNVAFELGFKQASHFCRQFKTLYRQTPTEFVFSIYK
jgi:transcriptional regulator GlxA family with amidase domain